jgi:hypothetical protein
MLRVIVVFGSLTACCCFGLLSVGGVAFAAHQAAGSHQDFPPRPGATPIVIGLPNLNPPTATAVPSGSHVSGSSKPASPPDAVRVALTNTYVKALLKGRAFRVDRVTAWISGKGKLVVVGFYSAATVSGIWMNPGKPPYHATYHKVTGIRVYVHLTQGVAGVTPKFRKR